MYKEVQIIYTIQYQLIVIIYMFTDTSFNVTHLEKRFDVLYDNLKIIICKHSLNIISTLFLYN